MKDVHNQKIENLIYLVTNEMKWYASRGLEISGVQVDNQFYNVAFKHAIKPVILIPHAAQENVSVAERQNRMVKERMQLIVAGVPYKSLSKVMVQDAAKKAKQMMIRFPTNNGVSSNISPEEIVEGKKKMDFSQRTIAYGHYAQEHDGTVNTAKSISVGGIAMHERNEREGFARLRV